MAAAESFVRLRMKNHYRDLIGLVEFGNEAYVVTPFTHDYENILLSISLIGDPVEFSMFPDQGTIIGRAIEEAHVALQAHSIFSTSAGNLIVIFSDGEDTHARLATAAASMTSCRAPTRRRSRCISCGRTTTATKGQVIPDELWIPAVEKTGGKFYAANNEQALARRDRRNRYGRRPGRSRSASIR